MSHKPAPSPPEFKIDDEVSIIRFRHGWLNGSVTGKITFVGHRSGGAAYYVVTDQEGQTYDIYASKDLRYTH